MAVREKNDSRSTAPKGPKGATRRTRVSQADVPSHTLTEALRVANALAEQYGKQPA